PAFAVQAAERAIDRRGDHGAGRTAAFAGGAGMSVIQTTIYPTALRRVAASRRFCQRLTKAHARNFYYGLKLLPEPKRSAMFALYAYMRLVDDIADRHGRSIEQREQGLEPRRARTRAALDGEAAQDQTHDIGPALSDLVKNYQI